MTTADDLARLRASGLELGDAVYGAIRPALGHFVAVLSDAMNPPEKPDTLRYSARRATARRTRADRDQGREA